jgi:hypothetical protein
LALAVLVLVALQGTTALPDCNEPNRSLLQVVLEARSWTDLDKVSLCVRSDEDDGAVAEALSGTVGDLLADKWATLPDLQQIIDRRPAFRQFVVRHIDITIPARQLDAIEQNAAVRCPRGAESLCQAVGSSAKSVAP